MAKARAEIEITAASARLASDLARTSSQLRSWSASVARSMDRQFSGVGRSIGKATAGKSGAVTSAVGHFGGNLLTKAFDKVVDAGENVVGFERDLTRLMITAKKTPAWANTMRDAIRGVSKETAVSSGDILKATSQYVALTGDVEGASTMMRTFARVAQASGSEMSDVATAAFALGDSLNIKPGQMEAVFSGLIEQGKSGAVELKDFAQELTALAPKFARFKGTMGPEGVIQLGAALQVARHGFGSVSEAATGIESLMGGLTKHAKLFAAAGVQVFDVHSDGTKTFRNLFDIVKDIGNSKLAKDPELLIKALGRKEGEAMINTWIRLLPMYEQMVQAGHETGTVAQDLGTYLGSSAGKIDAATNRMKVSLAETFTPDRIESFARAMGAVADMVNSIAKGLDAVATNIGNIISDVRGNKVDSNPYAPKPEVTTGDYFGMAGVGALFGSPLQAGLAETKKLAGRSDDERAATEWMAKNIPGEAGPGAVARKKLADEAAYAKSQADIGGQSGTAAQNRRAVELATGVDVGQAQREAGARYLVANKVSAKDQQAVYDQIQKDNSDANNAVVQAFREVGTQIVAALQQGPTVKLGDNQVAKSVSQSKNARTGGP
jgi:TP901 family phage tail tape measure protein